MKFFELKKGQAFRFANGMDIRVYVSAGVDGAYGRYVGRRSDWSDPKEWIYCAPNAEVVLEEV